MKDDLASLNCVPCVGGMPPLKGEALHALEARLGGGWAVVQEHHLRKEYKFTNFLQALEFVNRVGVIAEEQGHHPDIHLAWGRVVIEMWTHKINGLTESDFVLAAKADKVL